MNLLRKIYYAVRSVGLQTTLRTTKYSRYQQQAEETFGVISRADPAAPLSPKQLEGVNPYHNGAYFSFNDGLQVEISFLSAKTVRVTWGPGQLMPNYAVSGDETIALKASCIQVAAGWQLTAGALLVQVFDDGSIEYVSDGTLIRKDLPPVYEAPFWTHSAGLADEAVIHGLGERTRWNLRPGDYRFWNTDPGGSYGLDADPLYLTIPLYYCNQQAGGYLVFYENSHDGEARFGEEAQFRFVGGALRVYVIEGHLAEALEEYSRLTGTAPMPPLWALGFHHSRWGYQSASEVREVLQGFRQHRLPLSSFHLDIDYMDGYRVFSVDPVNFPDFDLLCEEMQVAGIKPVVILDPGVKMDPKFGPFTTGKKQQVFCTLPDGKPVKGLVWPGWVHFPDFTNPEARSWWGEYYKRMLDDGVAGFWHDMNEPASFSAFGDPTLPRVTMHHMEGRGADHEGAHNVYGLLMDMAGFDAVRQANPNQRPWLLTRSGWAGVQRYAWKWTGDVESTWEALRMTIGTVLGLGVSGIPFSGSDIGGFSGNPDAELYTRWFQMSTLMAFFRNHSAVTTERREPWVFGEETTRILREMLLLRERLLPYLYTLAWEAHQVGAPVARPLSWLDPFAQELWEVDDAYLLGDKIMVFPVVEPGARQRRVRFPVGGWYHFWDDAYFPDAGEAVVSAPIDQIPFFIREGSVLPQQEAELLTFHIYFSPTSKQTISYHYQDAGDGYGTHRLDTLILKCDSDHLSLQWHKEGEYPLPETVRLVMHGGVPDTTAVDGEQIDWTDGIMEIKPFEKLKTRLQ